jgi:hypothetical protein
LPAILRAAEFERRREMSIKGRCVVAGTMEVDGDQMDGLFIEVPMAVLRNSKNLIYCDVEVRAAEDQGTPAVQTGNTQSKPCSTCHGVVDPISGDVEHTLDCFD